MKKIFFILIYILFGFSVYSQNNYVFHSITEDTIKLDETIVYGSLKATNSTPFSFSNVSKTTLSIMPVAEAAYALSSTPSITFYADNGTNLGYVYYRLRGIDQTRLNVTLNGVPLNEPEDQGSYFNNFPNFLSGIDNVQIMRGAGLSKVGTSTFGGSLNFESKTNYGKPVFELTTSYGSNLTKLLSASVNMEKFFITMNKFSTDGYKYNSGNDSWSTNYGTDFKLHNTKVKLFGIIGKQENGMAWIGETLDQIHLDPRSNTNKIGERDDFLNIHNQLTFEHIINSKGKITYTLFHQYQDGWYDTDISHFDPSLTEGELMSRIQLNYNWFGGLYNQMMKFNNLTFNVGMSYNAQYRNHEGLSNYQYSGFVQDYTNEGIKKEFSDYIKAEYKLNNITFYGDVQLRYVNFKYKSITDTIQLYNNVLFNYSSGASYREGNNIFRFGFGQSSREPRRSDLLGGYDNYAGSLNNLKDETVVSTDFGYKYINDKLQFSANLYFMSFKNEFMATGEYGENAIALFTNVEKSYRNGIEISGNYVGTHIDITGNLTLSDNKFISNDIWHNSILSPEKLGNASLKYKYKKLAYAGINLRYNGEAYMDINNDYNLPSYTVLDAYIGLTSKIFELQLNFNNIANSLILTNGMIGFDGNPRYFVMNSFSSLATVKIKI